MVFPYQIDRRQRRATVTVPDIVRADDVAETIRALYRDSQWERGFSTFWDARKITAMDLALTDLVAFTQLQREYADVASGGRDVVLIKREEDYEVALLYETLAREGPRPSHVCRHEFEANTLLEMARGDSE